MAPQPLADLVVHGGVVLTADPARPLVEDGMVVVRGSRIAAVTDAVDREAVRTARRAIDAHGKVVTPGLVNIHTHTILCVVRGVAEDLGFAPAYTPGIPHGHEIGPEEAVALARLGALEALLFGSTLVNDTYVHADLTLPVMAELGLRVYACGRIHDVDFARVHAQEWTHRREIGKRTLGEALRLHEAWHGKEQGRLGVQLAAHAPDTCSRALLEEVRRARDATGLRVNTHLAQSTVEVARVRERDGMTPAELLESVGLLDHRLLAAHCIHLDEQDIERVGRAGITVAHIPKGNATGGTIAPTSKLRRAGAAIALGTDNMHGDMVEVMRWALNVGRVQEGRVDEFWQPRDVLAMATIGGARAMGLEDEIGSITVGKKADLVIFDFQRPHLVPRVNPLGTLIHTAQGRDVETVVVDGRVVVENGRPTLVDQDEILRRAAAAADALWARARGQT